ncbi:hypothetical protein BC833DRAFT_617968 [Globomyces pollinis-pini]|nr:hypothetical protein BC833DRAFT_617968 [Globomyces pollinis-pini]
MKNYSYLKSIKANSQSASLSPSKKPVGSLSKKKMKTELQLKNIKSDAYHKLKHQIIHEQNVFYQQLILRDNNLQSQPTPKSSLTGNNTASISTSPIENQSLDLEIGLELLYEDICNQLSMESHEDYQLVYEHEANEDSYYYDEGAYGDLW